MLLKQFRSVGRIRQLTEEELAAIVGQTKARHIHEYFAKKEKGPG
jgi:ERCC4-type nuclease